MLFTANQNLCLKLTELDISFRKIKSKIFLGGDFNLQDIDWEHGYPITGAKDKSHREKLCTILNSHYLEQVNTLLTRKDKTLDLFITSHPSLIDRCSTRPPPPLA